MAKPKKRNQKGTVGVFSRNGMLILRWTYQGNRHQLALGQKDSPINRHLAEKKASEIQWDMAREQFDPTLLKYRPTPEKEQPVRQKSTIDLFTEWTDFQKQSGSSDHAIHNRYKPLLANLKRFGRDIKNLDDARAMVDLLETRQSPSTVNRNLWMLKSFFEWLRKQGHTDTNPFSEIKSRKATRKRVQPFSREEIERLLTATKFHHRYSGYYDYIYTLLSLGLRPSEAIGLRWKHVDLSQGTVHICETLARSPDGKTSSSSRQRKGTKTDTDRVLPLGKTLLTLLQGRKPVDAKPDDLVFLTPKVKPIDDHTFSQRVWKSICETAGVTYRNPYCMRHTFVSHLIEEGANLLQAAALAGHSDARMVTQVYGHMVNRPKMPEF